MPSSHDGIELDQSSFTQPNRRASAGRNKRQAPSHRWAEEQLAIGCHCFGLGRRAGLPERTLRVALDGSRCA
jgi:hypothetical protein